MWVIYLEMGVALTLLILIVWWTWPAKRAGGELRDDGIPGTEDARGPHDGGER